MKTTLWVVTVLLAAGAAPGPDAKSDLAKLQGSWTNELGSKKHVLKFTKNTFVVTFENKDEKQEVKGTLKIDPAKKPKQMDMTITGGSKDDFNGKTAHVIYDLDGDTLKWCANKPGEEGRPEEFPAQEGGGKYLYLIFKRAK